MVPRKITVFGGDGFIGSHYLDQLAAQGHALTAFDRFSRCAPKNISHLLDTCTCIRGDFTDSDAVSAALSGQEVACHFVWHSTPVTSWDASLDEMTMNLRSSLQFFDACAKQGVRKIVFLSSGGTVYGNTAARVAEDTVARPFTPHGINKLAVEGFLRHYCTKYGMQADVYRIANAYGPRQPLAGSQGVIAVWMGKILSGKTIEVYAGENSIRDYVYVEDIAKLMTHSLASMETSGIYNIGTGTGVSLLSLLDLFKKVIGSPIKYRVLPPRPSDVKSSILASGKILEHFPGFAFKRLEDMIAHTWEQAKITFGATTRGQTECTNPQRQAPCATALTSPLAFGQRSSKHTQNRAGAFSTK